MHLFTDATTGLFAASVNVLVALVIVKDLEAKDKVIALSFAVRSFLFGDHLSFTANFQLSLIVAVMDGKLAIGICTIVFAFLLAAKGAEALEEEDCAAGLLAGDATEGSVVVEYYQHM